MIAAAALLSRIRPLMPWVIGGAALFTIILLWGGLRITREQKARAEDRAATMSLQLAANSREARRLVDQARIDRDAAIAHQERITVIEYRDRKQADGLSEVRRNDEKVREWGSAAVPDGIRRLHRERYGSPDRPLPADAGASGADRQGR